MSRYKYFPNSTNSIYRNNESLLSSERYRDALKSFFEIEEVQEAVNKNDLQKVFDLWVEPDKPGAKSRIVNKELYTYTYEDFHPWLLADFLYFEGIDFMSYLSDSFIEEYIGNGFYPEDILSPVK